MKGILIKITEGHQMNGQGEFLGNDVDGNPHTFWKQSGHMEVPPEIALMLEREVPKRFEMVDRKLAESLLGPTTTIIEQPKPIEPKPVVVEQPVPVEIPKPVPVEPPKPAYEEITRATLNEMTKDEINDWAARRWLDANTKDNKEFMISKLIRQIEEKTGKKVY